MLSEKGVVATDGAEEDVVISSRVGAFNAFTAMSISRVASEWRMDKEKDLEI